MSTKPQWLPCLNDVVARLRTLKREAGGFTGTLSVSLCLLWQDRLWGVHVGVQSVGDHSLPGDVVHCLIARDVIYPKTDCRTLAKTLLAALKEERGG